MPRILKRPAPVLRFIEALILCLGMSSGTAQDLAAVTKHRAIFTTPPRSVPTPGMPDGPLLGNGDVGLVLAGPPEAQRFHIGKNDFWSRHPGDASVLPVGLISLEIPALRGATYRQEQDLSQAEVRGEFRLNESALRTRTWVDATTNLIFTELVWQGNDPLSVRVHAQPGGRASGPAEVRDNGARLAIGREGHGGGRWYFDGEIRDVSVYDRALAATEITRLVKKETVDGGAIATWPVDKPNLELRFDGKRVWADMPVANVQTGLAVTAWIRISTTHPEANYIVSKGEWNQAYSLGLSKGCLRWAVGSTFVQTTNLLPVEKWIHVAGTFETGRLQVWIDGVKQAGLGDSESGEVMAEPGMLWFSRRADNLPGRGREAGVATRVLASDPGSPDDGSLSLHLAPGNPSVLVTAVLTDLDAEACLASAQALVKSCSIQTLPQLTDRHRKWWTDFWGRSSISIPDQEIEKRWYAALYTLASCSRVGKVAPGLWGPWVTTERPNWHGDFHLNYNFQAPYYLTYSANHPDLSLPFYQAIWESVPNGRAMARRHGWKGVHFPVCIGPWGLSPENPDGDWGQRSDAAFAALNFIWYYQYTQDREFLRTNAYPYLCEVADFWEDYLKLENGRYVIYNDSIHEGSGADVNPLLSLGLLRTLFGNLARMSEELGVDEQRRSKWNDIRARLSDFPRQQRQGKTVFRYSEKGTDWVDSNTLGIHHIFPAGAVGLDNEPGLLDVSRNTIEVMGRWHDQNGFSSWYTACARVGYDPEQILRNLRQECDRQSYPNLLLQYGGGGIENVAGLLAINEMLLQSHEGILRFFPVWPKKQDARFRNLRTVGAFLVTAEIREGVIREASILSERGRTCTLVNPWAGSAVRLARNRTSAELLEGDRLTFPTAAGELIELQPQK